MVVAAGPGDPLRPRCAASRSASALVAAAAFVARPAPVRARPAGARRRLLRRSTASSSRTAGTGSTRRRSARSGPGSASPHPDWIDRAVGRNADVAFLWHYTRRDAAALEERVLQPQRRATSTPSTGRTPPTAACPRRPCTSARDGTLVDRDRRRRRASRYAVSYADIAGTPIGARPAASGSSLYRVDGPLVILTRVTGVYARHVVGPARHLPALSTAPAARSRCASAGDAHLFTRAAGRDRDDRRARSSGAIRVAPTEQPTLDVPLRPDARRHAARVDVHRGGSSACPRGCSPAARTRAGSAPTSSRFDYRR